MTKIFLKEGVLLNGATSWLWSGITLAAPVLGRYTGSCTITSILDGKHSQGSLHYLGRAADLRSQTVSRPELERCLRDLMEALGPDWDVLLEKLGTPDEHFHIEFDPKGPRKALLGEA